jgi:RNA polymerase sigma factor (sigma-70 family)
MEMSSAWATDAELIASSFEEPQRFGLLFDRHFGGTHRYLRRRVGRELADDLAAETFVLAFDRRRSYDLRREDARPWLLGIASNLLRNQWRGERRRLLAYARTAVEIDPDADSDAVVERVHARAAAPLVAGALASLEDRDRDALLLLAWCELSYEEIAEALAIPVGTVRSRIHRARAQVSEALSGHGVSSVAVSYRGKA